MTTGMLMFTHLIKSTFLSQCLFSVPSLDLVRERLRSGALAKIKVVRA